MSRWMAAGAILLFGLSACSSTDSGATDSASADATTVASGEYADVEALRAAAVDAGLTCETTTDGGMADARGSVKCEDGTVLGTFWNSGFMTIAVRDMEGDAATPVLYGDTWAIVGDSAPDLQADLGGEVKAKSEF